MFFLNKDGSVASVADLVDNPEIMNEQPEWVKSEISERWTWEERRKKCQDFFFNPREVNTVKPYSLADCELYDYSWKISGDEFSGGLWRTSLEYAKAQAELFCFEIEEEMPHLEFTVSDGQIIDSPIAVLALPKTAVPPERVRFSLDGETVYETPEIIPPASVHVAIKGAYQLFGEGGRLDPKTLAEGEHTLYAEVVGEPSINCKTRFIVKKSK